MSARRQAIAFSIAIVAVCAGCDGPGDVASSSDAAASGDGVDVEMDRGLEATTLGVVTIRSEGADEPVAHVTST